MQTNNVEVETVSADDVAEGGKIRMEKYMASIGKHGTGQAGENENGGGKNQKKASEKKPLGKSPFDYFSELWGKYERSAKSSSV